MRKSLTLLLMAGLLLGARGAWADECKCAGCGKPATVQATAKADVVASKAHGYSFALPAAWIMLPARGNNDTADFRFRHTDPSIVGFYQVFEGAVTDDPTVWYSDARKRYQEAAQAMAGLDKIEFSSLGRAFLGSQPAWSFGFVGQFKNGPPVATRIIFTMRRNGDRTDIHEFVITGEAAAMAKAQNDVEALLSAVKFGG